MEFNETFWDDVEYYWMVIENITLSSNRKYFESKPNVIFATLTGETAYRVAAQDIEITKQEVRDALVSMYGEFRAEIVNILVTDWALNSLYLGTYSNTPIGVTDQTLLLTFIFCLKGFSVLYNDFVQTMTMYV